MQTVSSIMGVVNQVSDYTDDPVANQKQIDSIVLIADRLMAGALKEIGVIGVKEIPDSVISAYNVLGIRAAAQFIRMQPVIELCIPLKYLGLSADNPVKFRYNIKLNAIPEAISGTNNMDLSANTNPNVGFALNATDFWGEYMLAKKP